MTPLLQPESRWRPPRLTFAQTTPAVLRFQSGRRIRGKLQVVSVTGGLLSLPSLLDALRVGVLWVWALTLRLALLSLRNHVRSANPWCFAC
jgi:hypothetical protein